MPRPYTKRTRATREAATRRRIIDATIELHESLGGPATTITAIAARAQVSRVTVYRHFPDEWALLAACTGTYLQEHRPPDPGAWTIVPDVQVRLRLALAELYPFYRQSQGLLARADQELPTNPILRDVLAGYVEAVGAMREVLAAGWPTEDAALLRAAVGHAVAFATWHSLAVEQGLSDTQAASLMERLVRATADATTATSEGPWATDH